MKQSRITQDTIDAFTGAALYEARLGSIFSVDHYTDVSAEQFREFGVRNFTPRELSDTRTGALLIDVEALRKLQALRDALGTPLNVTSGYRSPSTNKAVGGHHRSAHMVGRAFDIHMPDTGLDVIYAAVQSGFTGIGVRDHGPIAARYMHLDDIERAAGRAFWTYA